jgi:hypothetical protein
MLLFLPVAGQGVAQFARARSAAPVTQALLVRWQPGQTILHEGPIENSASVLLALPEPVIVVNGLRSNLAFGATFPDARERFWDTARFRAEWGRPGRRFLISIEDPRRSVVAGLPAGSVHLIGEGGGRWLYSNLADRGDGG